MDIKQGFVCKLTGQKATFDKERPDYSYLLDLMTETFSIMDLVFYGIAIYEGYRFSFRLITEKSIQELSRKNL